MIQSLEFALDVPTESGRVREVKIEIEEEEAEKKKVRGMSEEKEQQTSIIVEPGWWVQGDSLPFHMILYSFPLVSTRGWFQGPSQAPKPIDA